MSPRIRFEARYPRVRWHGPRLSTRRGSRALASTLLGLALLAPAAQAGRPLAGTTDGPIEVFVDRVAVDLIHVDLVATDRAGQPVTDLAVGDFQVFEDGEPVVISQFGSAKHETSGSARGAVPADRPSLELVLFVDHANTLPHDLQRIVEQLEDFVATEVKPNDAVMVVSFDGGVHVETPMTTDPARLRAGMARLRARVEHGQAGQFVGFARSSLLGPSPAPVRPGLENEGCADNLLPTFADYAAVAYEHVTQTLDALRTVIDSLATTSSRKALLLATGGFPSRPGAEYQALISTWCPRHFHADDAEIDARPLLKALAEHANSNRVTVYGLHASGASDPAGRAPAAVRQVRQGNIRDPLIRLARATGGLAVLGTGDFRAPLAAIRTELGHAYSLGYLAPLRHDGAAHAIDVRVTRPDVAIRYRLGYRDQTLSERLADRTLSALLQAEEDNPHGVAIEVGLLEPSTRKKRFEVQLAVRIPLADVTFLPSAEGPAGKLRLLLGVLDSEGHMRELSEEPLALGLGTSPVDAVRRLSYVHDVPRMSFRAGEQRIVVAVYDELSENTSFVVQTLDIPGEGEAMALRH